MIVKLTKLSRAVALIRKAGKKPAHVFRGESRLVRHLSGYLLLYPGALLLLSFQAIFLPQQSGYLAIIQIGGVYFFLPLLLLLPFALLQGANLFRGLLAVCVLLFVFRFCSVSFFSALHNDSTAPIITALTWNVYSDNSRTDHLYDLLNHQPADIVALEEVSWPALYADSMLTHVYPYVLDRQEDSVPGIALLSIYPIVAHGVIAGTVNDTDSSGMIWARVAVDADRSLVVVAGHPNSPYIHMDGCSPVRCFDPRLRNRQLTALRTFIDPLLAQNVPVVILGDMNVTPQEPMYGKLVTGLQDAHRQLHFGIGATWRPLRLRDLPFGLLRLDLMLSSPALRPIRLTVDCTPRGSDHCVVQGAFALPMRVSA